MKNEFNTDLYWDVERNVPLLFKNGFKLIKLEKDIAIAFGYIKEIILKFLRKYCYHPKSIIVLSKFPHYDLAYKIYADGGFLGKILYEPSCKKLIFIPSANLAANHYDIVIKLPNKKHVKGKKFEIPVQIDREYFLFYDESNKIYGVGKKVGNRIKVLDVCKNCRLLDKKSSIKDFVKINKNYLEFLEKKVIEVAERFENTYKIVAFSGGKDSSVLAYILKDLSNEIIFINTGFEFPETLEYVKVFEKFIGRKIAILNNSESRKLVEARGLPTLRNKWCTWEFKIKIVKKYVESLNKKCSIFEAVRRYESTTRRNYKIFRIHPFIRNTYQIFPILNWRAIDVIAYAFYKKIPLNKLYRLGFERVGCYICPAMLEFEKELLKRYFKNLLWPFSS